MGADRDGAVLDGAASDHVAPIGADRIAADPPQAAAV